MIIFRSILKHNPSCTILYKAYSCILKNYIMNHTRPSILSPLKYLRAAERNISYKGNSEVKIDELENRLEMTVPRWPQSLHFSYVWLRDHCRCQKCYNEKTFQRIQDVYEISLNIRPASVKHNEQEVMITWPDGHVSKYGFKFLWENTCEGQKYARNRLSVTTWNKMAFPALETITIPVSQLKAGTEGKRKLMEAVLKLGVGIVSEVNPTSASTREAVEEICAVKKTFFGEMWSFEADLEHADTAYTKEFLGAHTDGTYCTEAPRLQVFHCLKEAEEGGETVLVDGFKIAELLRKSDPKCYDFLSSTFVPSEYVNAGHHHYKAYDVVFKHHPVTKRLLQFRYNLYDRAPLSSLPLSQVRDYYEHLHTLTSLIRQPRNEFWIKLLPGTVLFIDNWRVLHGRNQYEGSRVMGGCYLENGDVMSRARVLGCLVD